MIRIGKIGKFSPRFSHGFGYQSAEYRAWRGAKGRCYNKNNPKYKDYGGRGIKVCKRWLKSFIAFYADMGPKPTPKHSLDRKDNDGDYRPGNCRWATAKEQANNQRGRIEK